MGLKRGARRALLGGARGIRYLLRDEFTTDRAAGSVHGTPAEPGPGGTRQLVDAGDRISITGGVARFAIGGGQTDPILRYSDLISRAVGRIALFNEYRAAKTKYAGMGLIEQADTQVRYASLWLANTKVTLWKLSSFSISGEDVEEIGVPMRIAIVIGQDCYYALFKDGTNSWEILYRYVGVVGAAWLYAAIFAYGAVADFSRVAIPDLLWLPRPIAYDSFTRGDGALGTSETSGPDAQNVTGRTWNFDAGIWTVDTNESKGSPVAGVELITDTTFDTICGVNWTCEADWSIGGGIATKVAGAGDRDIYQIVLTVGTWYAVTWDLVSRTAGTFRIRLGAAQGPEETVPATYTHTKRASGVAAQIKATAGAAGTIDNMSVKALTLSELFASVDDAATSDVVISADVTLTAGTQAGIVMNLDDETTPANFVIGFYDGANAKLDKCVAGVWTSVISAAVTYAAGAIVLVLKHGTDYTLYYDNVKVGTTSTISDAGIISNTKHGLFSTYSENTLDNFLVLPRGTAGEYDKLDDY